MPSFNNIAVDKLARLIATPAAPALVDVRGGSDGRIIPGSIQYPADQVEHWAGAVGAASAVVIDDDGGTTAQAVAAWLRSTGLQAETLDGGYAAWRTAKLPTVSLHRLPRRDGEGRTLWVTRVRPKIDRIACPWLIRRFVDPRARFLFVPAGEVITIAERLGAAAFDLNQDGVFWSHRGERCTFDLMVEEFGLSGTPALDYLAGIVRGADTGHPDLVPEAAGLLAVSLGLSRMYADDLEQLEAGMLVYDALYRWCRDARDETHDWSVHQPREVRA
ncbi:sulfurtransferase/chromate resistance protein [Sphingomonas sp. MG17]|uniref:Sulfurtransferase/chromate resistance protein n=1 Tax=Sphingomonas tagetis TaxID=2949092 RepID=A0A9X2HQR7_9SPHN|nr:sulfurtransferase/chromate resistance protein [Sphingomonas tagetis]MCP3731763.1 sulfurtransferase/chromate resistance protein [Sphingomonas tagetis]